MKLNKKEAKCLRFLAKHYHEYDGGAFFSFLPISRHVRLNRKEVRRAVRSLKKKGLAQYKKGLCDHEGMFRGSGYSATEKGVVWVNP